MFNLIRCISHGVIPRADRTWEEDPTSNAPQRNRKRRLSSTERDDNDDDEQGKKKARASATPSVADADATFLTPAPEVDTKEVKEVTEGVKEVDLEDEETKPLADDDAAPESIPLPEEKSGELEESSSEVGEEPATTKDKAKVAEEEEDLTNAADDSAKAAPLPVEDDAAEDAGDEPSEITAPAESTKN